MCVKFVHELLMAWNSATPTTEIDALLPVKALFIGSTEGSLEKGVQSYR